MTASALAESLPLIDVVPHVHLDFETFSEADIKVTGGRLYVEHPSTKIMCLQFAIDDVGPFLIKEADLDEFERTGIKSGRLRKLYRLAKDPRVIFIAHNAAFEQDVWEVIMVKRYGFPRIPISRWKCTMAKSYASGLPGALADVGKTLRLPIQKDVEGKRIMLKLSRPRRITKTNKKPRWLPEDVPEDFAKLYRYCGTDVKSERLIDKKVPDLTPDELEVWETDQRMNRQGLHVDIATIRNANRLVTEHLGRLHERFLELTDCEVPDPKKRIPLLKWIQKRGVNAKNTQKATVRGILDNPKTPSDVREVLEILSEFAKTSLAKLPAMLDTSNEHGIIRDFVAYHAALTGRWGGRGIQIQNFPRPTIDINLCIDLINECDYDTFASFYPNVADALSSALRGMIVAPPGHELFVCDFSQMEARVLAWLAGQIDVLELFAAGKDLYCSEASKIFGRPIDKEEDKDERQVGKVAVLALGYQGGIGAFASMAKIYNVDLRPIYESIWRSATAEERKNAQYCYMLYLKGRPEEPVSKEVAFVSDIIKQRWRVGNRKIEQFWWALEKAAVTAVLTKKPQQCGKVRWFTKGIYLYCELPSGRRIAYPYPKVSVGRKGKKTLSYYSARYGRITVYGGKLAENVTQAVQRDLLAEALVRLEDKYPVTFHVHDECVAEVRKNHGSLQEFVSIMKKPPKWGKGLPIDAKGWKGKRYGKD